MSHAYQQTFVDIYAKAAFAKLYLAVNDFEHTETKAQSLRSVFQAARMPVQAKPRRLMNFWFFMGYPVLVPK